MFGALAVEVFAPMVFCKECRRRVEDCPHFVYPITAQRVSVFDPKIETLAYEQGQRILVTCRVCRYAESLRPKAAMIRHAVFL